MSDRRRARPRLWCELAVIATVYGVYTLTRNTLPEHVARARSNAMDVLRLERWLHIDMEHWLNRLLAAEGARPLAVVADYAYSLLHFVVPVAVLAWLYTRRPAAYRGARTALLLITALGLVGFWLMPLAPPRFFPALGFVDTVVRDHTWGSWGSPTLTSMSNQYAAMPSVHVAWSVWCADRIARYASGRVLRTAAVLYPLLVTAIVVATANHWLLDAVAGAVIAVVGIGLSKGLSGRDFRLWFRPSGL